VTRWIEVPGTDRFVAFEQQPPPDYQTRIVPLSKCLHLRFEPLKGNPEGRSMLRSAWPAHRDKKHIERMEGIGVERNLAGLHAIYVPPQWLSASGTPEDQAAGEAMKQIARNIKADEQQGLVIPAIFDEQGNRLVEITLIGGGAAGGQSQRVLDTGAIIQRLDQRILQLCMADFLLLGHEKVGSFALSSDKTALFAIALGVWLDTFTEAFNQQVVPQLLDLNGMPVEDHPRLMHGDLESRNLTEVADYLQKLAGAGMAVFPDPKLEAKLFDLADLPVPSPEELERRAEEAEAEKEFQRELERASVMDQPAGPPAKEKEQ
jgi:hypothetical protein